MSKRYFVIWILISLALLYFTILGAIITALISLVLYPAIKRRKNIEIENTVLKERLKEMEGNTEV